jgi:hypothetical protein
MIFNKIIPNSSLTKIILPYVTPSAYSVYKPISKVITNNLMIPDTKKIIYMWLKIENLRNPQEKLYIKSDVSFNNNEIEEELRLIDDRLMYELKINSKIDAKFYSQSKIFKKINITKYLSNDTIEIIKNIENEINKCEKY